MTSLRQGLPDNAKCVFKGFMFEVWQWDQKMFDDSTEIFEKIWRPSTVHVLPIVGDKIIIEDQDQPDKPDFVSLVCGRADDETDMMAEAKREMLEETGYESDDWELFLEDKKRGKILWDSFYYIARNCKKIKEQELDAGERISPRLVSFDEFFDLLDEPRFRIAVEFKMFLQELRYDELKKEAFRKKLFA